MKPFPEPEKPKKTDITADLRCHFSYRDVTRMKGFLGSLPHVRLGAGQALLTPEELYDFRNAFPDLEALAQVVTHQLLVDKGYCRVKGLPFLLMQEASVRTAFIIAMTQLMGTPTSTDRSGNTYAWPVKAEKNPKHLNLTFSQHQKKAPLHTDSQYIPSPEQAFGLWCIQPAKDGDGRSFLLNGSDIIEAISKHPQGSTILDCLFYEKFPFRTPTAFTDTLRDDVPEVIYKPILLPQGTIRYRLETILKGVASSDVSLTQTQKKSLEFFERLIHNPSHLQSFHLQAGEVVFVNNHRVLHGRSAFSDPDRELIRVRFNFSS